MDPIRVRLDLAYDGTGFAGWAKQPGLRTVQGELEGGLDRVLHLSRLGLPPARVTVAGRTDAGVHARGQVVHVDVPQLAWEALPGRADRTPQEALVNRLAGALPADLVVRRAAIAPPGFNARFSALHRTYQYRIADHFADRDPLTRNHVLWNRRPLDVAAMHAAMQPLLGLHDFAAFCRPRPDATTIRELKSFTWERLQPLSSGAQPQQSSSCAEAEPESQDLGRGPSTAELLHPAGFESLNQRDGRLQPASSCAEAHPPSSCAEAHPPSSCALRLASARAAQAPAEPESQDLGRGPSTAQLLHPACLESLNQRDSSESHNQLGGLVVGTITADAFCHNLVRALVGASIAVGEGRKPVDWPLEVLHSGRRELAAAVVPPQGLTLESVAYPPDAELAARAAAIRAKRELSSGAANVTLRPSPEGAQGPQRW